MELSQEQFQDLIGRRLLARVEETVLDTKEQKTEALTPVVTQPLPPTLPDFVKVEKNLASLYFFTPSSKKLKTPKVKTVTFTHTIDGKKIEATVTIIPSVIHGLPVTADQDKYLAFQKMLTEIYQREGRVNNPIVFSSAELIKLLGQTDGGINFDEVGEWLERIFSTTIKSEGAVYFAGKKVWAKDLFRVFDRVVSLGKEIEPGKVADKNYVWLSEWQLENINNNYLIPIDYETYIKLKNHIAKALVPVIQGWLFATRNQGVFEKRYDDFCQCLNIREYHYISDIRRQNKPSLDELKTYGYLRDWKVEKTSDEVGYKIVLYHGDKFYSDRNLQLNKKEEIVGSKVLQSSVKANLYPEQGRAETTPSSQTAYPSCPLLSEEERTLIKKLNLDFGVDITKAHSLVKANLDQTKTWLAAWPYVTIHPQNPAGFLIQAIEQHYTLPETYLAQKAKEDSERRSQERQAAIQACPLCNQDGLRIILQDGFQRAKPCTHDQATESKYQPA